MCCASLPGSRYESPFHVGRKAQQDGPRAASRRGQPTTSRLSPGLERGAMPGVDIGLPRSLGKKCRNVELSMSQRDRASAHGLSTAPSPKKFWDSICWRAHTRRRAYECTPVRRLCARATPRTGAIPLSKCRCCPVAVRTTCRVELGRVRATVLHAAMPCIPDRAIGLRAVRMRRQRGSPPPARPQASWCNQNLPRVAHH